MLDLPDSTYCIDENMAEDLREACRYADELDDVRLLLITGTGDVFSGRGTVMPKGVVAAPVGDRAAWFAQHRVADAIAAVRVPVIMAINGDALDHGLELALAGDLRIARSDVHFGLTHLANGTLPWDGGIQRLTRLVGPGWTRDLLLTSRVIDAEQALAIGLVNRVSDSGNFDQAVQELTDSIIAAGPIAAQYTKETVNQGMDLTLEQGLRLEADLNVILQSTSDRREGLQSFAARRRPNYSGR